MGTNKDTEISDAQRSVGELERALRNLRVQFASVVMHKRKVSLTLIMEGADDEPLSGRTIQVSGAADLSSAVEEALAKVPEGNVYVLRDSRRSR